MALAVREAVLFNLAMVAVFACSAVNMYVNLVQIDVATSIFSPASYSTGGNLQPRVFLDPRRQLVASSRGDECAGREAMETLCASVTSWSVPEAYAPQEPTRATINLQQQCSKNSIWNEIAKHVFYMCWVHLLCGVGFVRILRYITQL